MHTANIIFTNIIRIADKHNIPKGKMHSNCMILPDHIVCKITQRNNIRRANTCDPALKQNLWKEQLDALWDHSHNTHNLWKTKHSLSNRAPQPTLNTSITFNKITTTPKHIANCFTKQFTHINRATHKIQGYNITLTTTQVQEAIKQSKNKNSQGPDKQNIRHIKHIGPLRLVFLTSIISISAPKSLVTLFTPDPVQVHHLVRSPKLLEVYLDTFFSFNTHCLQVANRVSKRNNVLKALPGTNWGQEKETLLMTYKALGILFANYASPLWNTNASESNIGKIQCAQNEALRIITCSHKMSGIDYLHSETEMLQVEDNLMLLSAQYLVHCLDTKNVCHHITKMDHPPQEIKYIIITRHNQTVLPLHANNKKDTLQAIHTSFVNKSNPIDNMTDNRVLNNRTKMNMKHIHTSTTSPHFCTTTSSAVHLSSVFGCQTETDMQMRGPPAEIASLHHHTECVYL